MLCCAAAVFAATSSSPSFLPSHPLSASGSRIASPHLAKFLLATTTTTLAVPRISLAPEKLHVTRGSRPGSLAWPRGGCAWGFRARAGAALIRRGGAAGNALPQAAGGGFRVPSRGAEAGIRRWRGLRWRERVIRRGAGGHGGGVCRDGAGGGGHLPAELRAPRERVGKPTNALVQLVFAAAPALTLPLPLRAEGRYSGLRIGSSGDGPETRSTHSNPVVMSYSARVVGNCYFSSISCLVFSELQIILL